MNHLSQIAQKLPEHDLDALLITSEPGERYALGFHGEGVVLVTRKGAHYSTDGRYMEQAKLQVTGAELTLTYTGKGHMALAKEYMKEHHLERVGFESGQMPVDEYHRWAELLPCILTPAQGLLDGLRASKDPQELEAMRQAQRITDQAFGEILNFIRPGRTEREIAARLVYELLRLGGEKMAFDPIVAAGANGSKPHAQPGDQAVAPGMFLTMDFGCVWEGYCSDMTRTVCVGQPTEEMERVYQTVLDAQKAGIAAARAGVTGKSVDAAARQVMEEAGYEEYFSHSLGHSLGLEIHESPNLSYTNEKPLPVGAVTSVEPGIYLPGRFGVRIEDVVALGETGCETLTQSPKNLIVL